MVVRLAIRGAWYERRRRRRVRRDGKGRDGWEAWELKAWAGEGRYDSVEWREEEGRGHGYRLC